MGIDFFNCPFCDIIINDCSARSCGNPYCEQYICDDCINDMIKKYGYSKEKDYENRCAECDECHKPTEEELKQSAEKERKEEEDNIIQCMKELKVRKKKATEIIQWCKKNKLLKVS